MGIIIYPFDVVLFENVVFKCVHNAELSDIKNFFFLTVNSLQIVFVIFCDRCNICNVEP